MTLIVGYLQYRMWFGDASFTQIHEYEQRLTELNERVADKQQRNQTLYAEVLDLRKGQEAIEERARDELGMIKSDETFFQVIEGD